jgi:RNA polymerase sigma-70 factor (ECF subfamily)
MLGKREDAEEAAQDVFLKAHRGLAGFRGESDLRTWLYRITVNTCLTRLRTKQPDRVHPDSDDREGAPAWERLASTDPGPEDILMEKDIKEIIGGALDLIPARDKEIVLLFYVDGLKYEEIAGALGIPGGTVCARLHRARKRLKAALIAMHKEAER